MCSLSEPLQKQLLALARSTIKSSLANIPDCEQTFPMIDGQYGGAFVTLWVKRALRGCIGSFAATDDLVSTIRRLTLCSLQDERFADRRMSAGDLEQLVIEISLLSPLLSINDPQSVVIGKHGIVVRKGRHQGCFLPKVAIEHGWDAETFLTQVCAMKAKLPSDAWRQPSTQIYTFAAQVFTESQASI